ncbi:MAG: hypothetical protein K6W08_04105 [Firmicutes bacterium]|nr:hypothetical protein [Bacillota bacterium]
MYRRAGAAAIIVALLAGLASAAVPPGGIATLSLVGEDGVELVYQRRTIELPAASFAQTLLAMSIVAGTPPGPWNPWLVDTALHAAGIPHLDARSGWPGDGALVIVPTAPTGAVDAALAAAGRYFDPNAQPQDFAAAYWQGLFGEAPPAEAAPPGWPGRPSMEALKEAIVGGLPFPANLGPMTTYQARGIVPFMLLRGEYQVVCFLWFCWWWPKVRVSFRPVAEGYGLRDVR